MNTLFRQFASLGLPNLAIALALAWATAVPVAAEMCSDDSVPSATLLLPYFEVDYADSSGETTLMQVNNALPEPILTHVTFWTDWGWPSIDFDVFLTGYDVVELNLRDVFQGNIPITADEQSDPNDFVSPHGSNPEWDGSYTAGPDCINFFPFFINPVIGSVNLDRLQLGHAGQDLGDNGCVGEDLTATGASTSQARGYITIDVVNECSTDFPSDPGYFAQGGTGVASNRNALWGDFFIVDPAQGLMASAPLVHIEASDDFDASSTPNNYTFYGRFTQGQGGGDNREPLPSQWAARYYNGGGSDLILKSDFVVWRDTTADIISHQGWACDSSGPPWKPLPERAITCFDEQENAVDVCVDEESCFPRATQRVAASALSMPFSAGWCRLDLGIPSDDFAGDTDFPAAGGQVAQSHVIMLHQNLAGTFLSGLPAVGLRHACEVPGLSTSFAFFSDGFESGNTSRWSNVQQ